MAEETVDALVLTTRFDESGLDRSAQQQIAGLQAFVNQINRTAEGIEPVEFDVSNLAAALEAAGGDVSAFFAGVKEGVEEGIADFQRLAAATQQVQPPNVAPPAVTDAGNQQLRILAALVEEERQLEQQVGDLTNATARLEAEETALAASMARQAQAAAQAGAAAQVQADAVLRAQQTAAQAQRLASAVGQQIVAPTVRLDPNVARLAQGYIQTTQAAQALARAQIGLARTTDPVAAGMARASAGANAWAQGLANIQRAQQGATSAAALSGRGFNKIENALTGILLASGGVPRGKFGPGARRAGRRGCYRRGLCPAYQEHPRGAEGDGGLCPLYGIGGGQPGRSV
jgi:predicted  nucleic acid-binding Zn-ribbon protein